MFAYALADENFGVVRMPRPQVKPARKGPVSPHQRLVMKAMAVFAGSEVISGSGDGGESLFGQATEVNS
jgi:hypothetical protein